MAGPEDSKFSKRMPANLVTEVLYVLASSVIGLFLVPYYIGELGIAAYAIVPLATSVTSYVMVFSDAFCSAVNRYFVVSLKSGDENDALLTYSTSLTAIGKMMLMVMPIMAAIAFLSPTIFDITGSSATSVTVLFLLVLWSAIIVAVGSCFNNALIAVNKLYTINMARTGYLVIQIAIVVALFLVDGPRLEHIGIAYILAALFYLVTSYVMMKRDFPSLRYDRSASDKIRMKEIGNLGVWSVINRISTLLFLQATLVVANICLGTVEEGRLSLVVSMVSMVSTACMTVSNVFNPYYYKCFSESDLDGVVSKSITGMRLMAIAVAMPLAFICVFSDQIMTVWVGEEFIALRPIILVMFAFLAMQSSVAAMDAVPTIMLKVKAVALTSLALGLCNVAIGVSLALFTDLGILGIALSWSVTMTLRNCVFCPIYYSRILKTDLRRLIRPQIESMLLFIITGAILFAIDLIASPPASLVIIIAVFLIIYIAYILLAMRAVPREEDREFFKESFPPAIVRMIIGGR